MTTDADFVDFLTASPSSYHAAAEVGRVLTASGYSRQLAEDPWDGRPGGHFLISGGAIVTWWIPQQLNQQPGFRCVGVHTDSPTLKLKPNPAGVSCGYRQAQMEVYGGLLLNSVLDRDLGLAGRVVTRSGDEHLVRTGPWLRVPQLAIHLDRSVNDGLTLDRQRHLVPIVGQKSGDVIAAVGAQIGVDPSDIAAWDLFAFPTEAPQSLGIGGEFLAAARLDNLASVFAAYSAMLAAEESGDIRVLAAFDHEEIGSASATGAAGPLLETVMKRIAISLGINGDDWHRLVASSICISADVAHGIHPNYPEKHDPNHAPVLNHGPVTKVNANQRYATEGLGMATWLRACQTADVPNQVFVANNAMPCGSTIGPITATRLGIRTVDVGIPILSMHSLREMCGQLDLPWFTSALTAFYSGV